MRADTDRYLDERVDVLRSYVFSSLPASVYDSVVEMVLAILSDYWSQIKAQQRRHESGSAADKPEIMHKIQTTERYAKLILHPQVKTLDLSEISRVLRSELLVNMSKMLGLEKLNISSRGHTSSVAWKALWKSMQTLTRLRHFTLKHDCQNECLAVLGQNCPHLVYVDVSGSQAVSDAGANWLLHCAKLKVLDLYQTGVNVPVYASLLLGLKDLATVGRCDKFGQVLEYMASHQSTPRQLCSVRVCHSRDMSREQLQLLSQMCPKLTQVSLYVDEDMGDLLTPLTQLKELEELKLLACNFYADKVDVLLRTSGHQLTLLHLEHIDELDMNALTCIAESCPNLEKLVFFSCDFVENFGPSKLQANRPASERPFRNLQVLVCISESAPNVIEFLLVNADRLRRVQFGSTAWFNDATVASVLAKGALKNVEEIRILRSYELTISSVLLLIDKCPKLRVLSEMEGWEGIKPSQLHNLRQKVRRENLQLDTEASWNIITG